MDMATDAGMDRLLYIVAQTTEANVTTRSGIVKPKTKKQREIEAKVAEEVVRFAFDHGGYKGDFLAPGGLYLHLLDKVRGH